MGLLKRMVEMLTTRADQLLDRYDDPKEALDYAYELEVEELHKVRRSIAHVATSYQHLELEVNELESAAAALTSRARDAARAGRDDLAREAIARRHVVKDGIASLRAEHDDLAAEDERFIHAAELLESKVGALGARIEAVKAGYALNGSRSEIDETISVVRTDTANADAAVDRAETKVAELRARTRAIDQLLASGALADLARSPVSIEVELRRARTHEDLERELSELKATTG